MVDQNRYILSCICLLMDGKIGILLFAPLFTRAFSAIISPTSVTRAAKCDPFKGPAADLLRCFHLFWLISPLPRLRLGSARLLCKVTKLNCLIKTNEGVKVQSREGLGLNKGRHDYRVQISRNVPVQQG